MRFLGFLVGVLSRTLSFLLSSIMHPKVKTKTRATIANSKSENIFFLLSCFRYSYNRGEANHWLTHTKTGYAGLSAFLYYSRLVDYSRLVVRYVSSSQSATAECLIRISHYVGNSPILDFVFLSVSRRIELFWWFNSRPRSFLTTCQFYLGSCLWNVVVVKNKKE